jgi:type IV fimbrial biogenesis protein FimT
MPIYGASQYRGVTLWELMWTLAIAATVITWGVPGFKGFLLDARRTADINAFVLAVQLSRSEAAKRGRPIVLCNTTDRLICAENGETFDTGWMVFVNSDDARPPQRSEDEDLLYFHAPRMEGSISANRRLFEFRPFGWRSTNGTITFGDERGQTQARAVIVSYTGRPRVSIEGPGGRELRCARLT